MSELRPFELRPSARVLPTGPHPLAIGAAWIFATALGLGAGTWLLSVAQPEEEWIGSGFVTAMFLAQYVVLALLGRSSSRSSR